MKIRPTFILLLLLGILSKEASVLADSSTAEPILYLIEQNIVTQAPLKELRLHNAINEAEAIKIALSNAKLHYFEGKRLESLMNSPLVFTNIAKNHWAYPYYVYAYQRNLIASTDMDPAREITRSQELELLLKSYSIPLMGTSYTLFTDIAPEDKSYPYFAYAYENNLIMPLDTKEYLPSESVSREEFMTTAYRLTILNKIESKYQIMPMRMKCKATYYSDFFNGRTTAQGEIFDQNLSTAAHLTLPFGTLLEIFHPETNQKQIIRINDRGPYDKRFCLDLSRSAFEKFTDTRSGWTWIEYRILAS